jgi:hypothetical protein
VFIRLLPTLLVASRQFRATKSRVTALLFAPPPGSAENRLGAFRSELDCSPDVRRREQSRSFKYVDLHILEGMLSTQKCEVDHARADFTGIANSTTQHF